MKRQIWILFISLSALFVLTGCWDRAELPEKGFVMGIALDKAGNGDISLTTQVFKPTQGLGSIGGKSTNESYANVTTVAATLPRAIRDIPINLGRKTQWSHTRLIIIGEELAREQEIFPLLEFFYRDHEPRLTVSIMITQGRADKYLNIKPIIENTISQQLFQSEKSSAYTSGKTIDTNLLKLGLQMKSEVGNATVPYLYLSKDGKTVTNIAGVAMLKKGKYVGKMEPSNVEMVQMLLNKYRSGMIEVPCQNPSKPKQSNEVIEIISLRSKWQPTVMNEDSLKVQVKVNAEIALMELSCSNLEAVDDEIKFAKQVEETIKQRIEETTRWLKKNKFDAIGLGNKIYQKKPTLWKEWKPQWDDRFATTQFDISVDVKVINSGTSIGNPIFQK
ncbi:Ger(x)C family spore germination protein [Paenibacillus sp. LjRoot153]|uniref:Ger(x)C family spore germination protein n=1 Tax=Paenibacillus sp. LjRoot153 TaxID=3342270 RepID=UPI003ECC91E4